MGSRPQSDYWERLHELSSPLYAWICLRTTGGSQRLADPDDVFQEIAIRGHEAYERLADPDRFRAWIFGIGRNVLREELRALAARTPRSSGDPGVGAPENIADELTSISRKVARGEEIQRLLETVATLDDDDRQLVILRGLEELTYQEIGAHLGLQEEATKKRWQRLRTRIQSTLLS